jgi:ankyrin repeat protein
MPGPGLMLIWEQILLGQGADSEVFDGLGNTALHYASAYGHLKV